MTDSTFYLGEISRGGVLQSGPPNIYGDIIRGQVYWDNNNNGIQDMGDSTAPNIHVGLYSSNYHWPFYFTRTDSNGNYALGVIARPTDTVRPTLPTPYIENIHPPYIYIPDSAGDNRDFGIYLTPNVTDLQLWGNYMGRPRPGFDLDIGFTIRNIGTTQPGCSIVSNIRWQSHLPQR